MKKKISFICPLFFILTALFSACHKEKTKVPSDISAPDYHQKQFITEIKYSEILPTYANIGAGQFAVIYTDDAAGHTDIKLYDIDTGKTTDSASLDCYTEFCRSFENGKILLYDYSRYYLISPDTNQTTILNVPETPGYFSHDMQKYYYVKDDVLYCMDMQTRYSQPISNEYSMTINALEGIHPKTDLLSVYAYTSAYSSESAFGILDPKTGKILAFGNTVQGNPVYHDERFYNIFFDSETEDYSIRYGTLNKTDSLRTIPLPELQEQNSPSIHFMEGSDYAIAQYPLSNDSSSSEEYRTELWYFGDTFQKYVFPDRIAKTAILENSIYLSETDLIVSSFSTDTQYSTILIDPHFAKFEEFSEPQEVKVDSYIDKTFLKGKNWENCPENLKEFRQRITALQDQYHVQILIGEHAQKALHEQGHETLILEDPEKIKEALNELETALSRYPHNFFRQFKDNSGNGGMIFLLCGEFLNEDVFGILPKGGHAEAIGNRYYIASCCHMTGVFHHEIWHATENLIEKKNPNAFDLNDWNSINPKGYSYSDYDIANDPEPNKWTLDSFGNETVYFVDNYSRTDPKEDRANLMQYAIESLIPSEELTPGKPLYKKLKIMSDEIHSVFDTTGWNPAIFPH